MPCRTSCRPNCSRVGVAGPDERGGTGQVVGVGGRDLQGVHGARHGTRAHVGLEAEVPVLALLGLAGLRVAPLAGVLRARGRLHERRVHDGACAHAQALGLEGGVELVEQGPAQAVDRQQGPDAAQRGGVGHGVAAAHEGPDGGRVPQRVLGALVGELEGDLRDVHAQHRAQGHRRAAAAGLGVVRLHPGRPRAPGDLRVEQRQEPPAARHAP